MRYKDHYASYGIKHPFIQCIAFTVQGQYILFIGRHIHLKRCAMRNLVAEISGRTKSEFYFFTGLLLKQTGQFFKCELQIGCSSNYRYVISIYRRRLGKKTEK